MKKNNIRSMNIDILKGLAIISVILLHTYNGHLLLSIGAPLHIWQAVPIFMILQGVNNTNSYLRNDFNSLKDFLKPSYFMRKFQRLLFPYTIFFITQIIFLKFTNPMYLSSNSTLERFFTGGRGPGSYFIPLSLQTQLVLPLIYLFLKEKPKTRLFSFFIFSLLLEIFSLKLPISEELYRILFIRFTFGLALGIAFSLLDSAFFKTRFFQFLIVVSVIYIIGVMYFDWLFIMEKYWHSQHALGFFWPLFLIVLFKQIKFKPDNNIVKVISLFGKASYHIFLVQLFYFWKPISEEIPKLPIILETIVNVLICTTIGFIFYKLENNFWQKVRKQK